MTSAREKHNTVSTLQKHAVGGKGLIYGGGGSSVNPFVVHCGNVAKKSVTLPQTMRKQEAAEICKRVDKMKGNLYASKHIRTKA